MALEGIQTHNH